MNTGATPPAPPNPDPVPPGGGVAKGDQPSRTP